MSQVGFYRYKTTADVAKSINLTINFVNVASKEIVPIDVCTGDLILKYLDRNGQYRFHPFNKYYETKDQPEKIGSVDKFLTSILTDQGNTSNVGYNNTRTISATTEATAAQLEKLKDIYASPRVYLYIGAGITDLAYDWLEVEIKTFSPVVRRRRANTGDINLNIILPEHYTIKMI